MDKNYSEWTRDDWRKYLKDKIKSNLEDMYLTNNPLKENLYRGKVQAYKDTFSIMFPEEDWRD